MSDKIENKNIESPVKKVETPGFTKEVGEKIVKENKESLKKIPDSIGSKQKAETAVDNLEKTFKEQGDKQDEALKQMYTSMESVGLEATNLQAVQAFTEGTIPELHLNSVLYKGLAPSSSSVFEFSMTIKNKEKQDVVIPVFLSTGTLGNLNAHIANILGNKDLKEPEKAVYTSLSSELKKANKPESTKTETPTKGTPSIQDKGSISLDAKNQHLGTFKEGSAEYKNTLMEKSTETISAVYETFLQEKPSKTDLDNSYFVGMGDNYSIYDKDKNRKAFHEGKDQKIMDVLVHGTKGSINVMIPVDKSLFDKDIPLVDKVNPTEANQTAVNNFKNKKQDALLSMLRKIDPATNVNNVFYARYTDKSDPKNPKTYLVVRGLHMEPKTNPTDSTESTKSSDTLAEGAKQEEYFNGLSKYLETLPNKTHDFSTTPELKTSVTKADKSVEDISLGKNSLKTATAEYPFKITATIEKAETALSFKSLRFIDATTVGIVFDGGGDKKIAEQTCTKESWIKMIDALMKKQSTKIGLTNASGKSIEVTMDPGANIPTAAPSVSPSTTPDVTPSPSPTVATENVPETYDQKLEKAYADMYESVKAEATKNSTGLNFSNGIKYEKFPLESGKFTTISITSDKLTFEGKTYPFKISTLLVRFPIPVTLNRIFMDNGVLKLEASGGGKTVPSELKPEGLKDILGKLINNGVKALTSQDEAKFATEVVDNTKNPPETTILDFTMTK